METFLCKIKNKENNCVKYLDISSTGSFLEEGKFLGLIFNEKNSDEVVEELRNNYDNVETILTKEEWNTMFSFNDNIKSLGTKIERGSTKFSIGIDLVGQIAQIFKKLRIGENKQLFSKVIQEEIEFMKENFNLTDKDIENLFEKYPLYFKDRNIIKNILNNDKNLDKNLLNDGNYIELEDNRILLFNL